MVQSAANLLFHGVVGRTLNPAEYGALGTVLAAMTLVAVPLSALQTASARPPRCTGCHVDSQAAAGSHDLVCRPVVLLLVLGAGPVAGFLHLDSTWDAVILAPLCWWQHSSR